MTINVKTKPCKQARSDYILREHLSGQNNELTMRGGMASMIKKCAFDCAQYVPSRAANAQAVMAADWTSISTMLQ